MQQRDSSEDEMRSEVFAEVTELHMRDEQGGDVQESYRAAQGLASEAWRRKMRTMRQKSVEMLR